MAALKTIDKAQATSDTGTELKPAEKKLLYSALAHLQGHINFERVAFDIEVPNAEAA